MEKVRLAIVGLGRRGTGLIKAIFTENERCEIVAICDLYRDRVDDTAELIKEKTGHLMWNWCPELYGVV